MILSLLICLALPTGLYAAPDLIPSTETPPLPSILIIYSGGEVFNETIKGINDEVENEFLVHRMVIDRNTIPSDIAEKIQDVKPKAAVLMDNQAIGLFRTYQQNLPADAPVIPSISLMAIDIENAIKDLKNAKGIFYDVPVVTALVNLRSVLKRPIKRTGVIHRDVLTSFIETNQRHCKNEGIELFSILIPSEEMMDYKKGVKRALTVLLNNKRIDSLWLPNDPKLLSSELLRTVWVPMLRRRKIPIIVGVEALVQPEDDFGTFAVLPDHISLGNQVADMLRDVQYTNWQFEDNQFRENRTVAALSSHKIINYRQARKRFKVKEEQLEQVDKVLK